MFLEVVLVRIKMKAWNRVENMTQEIDFLKEGRTKEPIKDRNLDKKAEGVKSVFDNSSNFDNHFVDY